MERHGRARALTRFDLTGALPGRSRRKKSGRPSNVALMTLGANWLTDRVSFETKWHYVSITYKDALVGLMVETDKQEEALWEAQQLCEVFFGTEAKIVAVKKIILQ